MHAGTLFVLVKRESTIDSLLAAIRDNEKDRIKALIRELAQTNPTSAPAKSEAIKGTWRLVWTEQASNANPLQKALSGQVRIAVRVVLNLSNYFSRGSRLLVEDVRESTYFVRRSVFAPAAAVIQLSAGCKLQRKLAQVKNWQIITDEGDRVVLENRVDLGIAKIRAMATCTTASDTRTNVDITNVFAQTFGQQIPLGVKTDDGGYVDWEYVDERIRISYGSKGSLFVHEREHKY